MDRELLHKALAYQLLSQEHTGFSLWCERSIAGDDEEGRLFLSHYLAKAPVSLERITITEASVRIHAERRTSPDWQGTPLNFLARLSPHIPNTFEHIEPVEDVRRVGPGLSVVSMRSTLFNVPDAKDARTDEDSGLHYRTL